MASLGLNKPTYHVVMAAIFAFSLLAQTSDAQHRYMNCSQCNMPLRNVANLCNDPRQMSNCIGCMKTVTKVKIRDSGYIDGWERLSQVTSKFCMRAGSMNVKPEGCYKQLNNGGYTERCYCYSDNCNSKAHRISSYFTLAMALPFMTLALVRNVQ